MRFDLDKIVNLYEQALYVRSRRTGFISSNIANADTPNYKAQDIDFKSVLRNVADEDSASRLKTTSERHLQPAGGSAFDAEVLYRQPFQASIDGNTVDPQIEKAEFAQNAVQYQASLDFLGGRFKGLTSAIKGRGE